MIKKEEMKPGLLVWWSANRYMKSWSCPAIVTVVDEESFKVQSLDDFKETEPLRMNDIPNLDKSVRNTEMRICTTEEVLDYFKNRTRHLEDIVISKTRELKDAEDQLAEYQKKTEKFIKNL